MKVKVVTTEIEASAEELRQSNTLSESFTQILRRSFIPAPLEDNSPDYEEEEDEA